MCDCPRSAAIETGWGLNICSRCGVSQSAPISNVVNHAVPCSTRPPYSKHKRFAKLLCHTYGYRVSKIHQSLVDALNTTRIESTQDIYNLIRSSKGPHMKRYDALAHLSQYRLDKKIMPLSRIQTTWASHVFREVVSLHAHRRGTFPAYSWCIEKCLLAVNRLDLLQYVHCLKCKKRRIVYEKLYGRLFRIPSGVLECPSRQHQQKLVPHLQLGGCIGTADVRY